MIEKTVILQINDIFIDIHSRRFSMKTPIFAYETT